MKVKYLIFVLFIIKASFSQNVNITNCSSLYSNNVEYNTGEIFVVYNFNSNETTSKYVVNDEVNIDNSQIKLYPIPTVNILYYSLPENIIFESIVLYDQYQKIIFSSCENTKQISIGNLPTGNYYVMFNQNKKYTYKVIKN